MTLDDIRRHLANVRALKRDAPGAHAVSLDAYIASVEALLAEIDRVTELETRLLALLGVMHRMLDQDALKGVLAKMSRTTWSGQPLSIQAMHFAQTLDALQAAGYTPEAIAAETERLTAWVATLEEALATTSHDELVSAARRWWESLPAPESEPAEPPEPPTGSCEDCGIPLRHHGAECGQDRRDPWYVPEPLGWATPDGRIVAPPEEVPE